MEQPRFAIFFSTADRNDLVLDWGATKIEQQKYDCFRNCPNIHFDSSITYISSKNLFAMIKNQLFKIHNLCECENVSEI